MAAPIYKQYGPARTVFCLLFAAVFLGFMGMPQAQPNPVYTVEGVEVDVTAKNAVMAREKAMEEAQVKAYQVLAERLLGPEELKTFQMPDPLTVSSLVQDLEVTSEQLSRVRYKGIFTVRFRPNAMKSQMASQGRAYSDEIKKPILVLPFYQVVAQTVLWSDGNPWMNAWRNLPIDKSMMQPTVVPLGDANDVAQVSDDDVMGYDPMQMQAMATRYNADDVVLLLAANETAPTGQRLAVTIYKHGFNGPEQVQKVTFDRLPNETDPALFTRAAMKIKSMLRADWKANAAYSPNNPYPTQVPAAQPEPRLAAPIPYTRQTLGPSTTYPVYARFTSVQEWVRLKAALDRTPGVQGVLVKALKPRESLIDVRFAGNINQMQSSLQGNGILMRATSANGPVEIYMNTVTPQQPAMPHPYQQQPYTNYR